MNKIIISGRLTKDIELKTTGSGTEVVNFTLAVDRRVKKGAERQCDFIDCTAFGKTAAFIAAYFKKGSGVTIDGRMESRKWVDSDGKNRVSWGVTVDNVEFPVGGRSGDGGRETGSGLAEMQGEEALPF